MKSLGIIAAAWMTACGSSENAVDSPPPEPPREQERPPAEETTAPETDPLGALAPGSDSEEPSEDCRRAIEATVEHARALHEESRHATPESVASIGPDRYRCVEPFETLDLNLDGVEDFAVTERGGGSMPGANPCFLFVTTDDGLRFVGHVQAHPVNPPFCASTTTNGFCDVKATEMMIHGDEQTHRYEFDGTRYRDRGVVHRSAPEPP